MTRTITLAIESRAKCIELLSGARRELYSVANYDLYMTQAKLVFVIINHNVMIKHAIECIVLN
jgi:hypothetical protein